jgi:L-alanine-DL-glutamate epimerase-like enolase superfamily enzyme
MKSAVSTASRELRIAGYRAGWVRLPLRRPYVVAYEAIESFDLFITHVEFEDGSKAFGEACPLPGYTPDTADSLWTGLRELVPALKGKNRAEVSALLAERAEEEPFLVAALVSPLEWNEIIASGPSEIELPLIGTVLGTTPEAMHLDARDLLLGGYRTLKMKVGKALQTDLDNLRAVQDAVRGFGDPTVNIRIDANQAYAFEDAQAFLERIDPANVQLFEQPLGDGQWDELARLEARVPIMLDEWIVDEESIRRASEIPGVAFVKFKLMKAGGFERLRRLTDLARENGLQTILGNGVAGDIGCLGEAIAAERMGYTLAGEMNGFLKTKDRLLRSSILDARNGKLYAQLDADEMILDRDVVVANLIDRI